MSSFYFDLNIKIPCLSKLKYATEQQPVHVLKCKYQFTV